MNILAVSLLSSDKVSSLNLAVNKQRRCPKKCYPHLVSNIPPLAYNHQVLFDGDKLSNIALVLYG